MLNNNDLRSNVVRGWFRETVNVIYELMSAFLCVINNRNISFVKEHDFVLDEYPAEVKTLSKEPEQDTQVKYPFLNLKISEANTQTSFQNLMKDLLILPNIENHLKAAIIKQKGRLVFLNVILENAPAFLTSISEYKDINLEFSTALENAFYEIKDRTIIPVKISFHAIHETYTIFSITIITKVKDNSIFII